MFSKKISRRSFLKVSAVTTAMAAMGLPAFAAEDTAEENCFQTLNIPRAHRQHRGQKRPAGREPPVPHHGFWGCVGGRPRPEH